MPPKSAETEETVVANGAPKSKRGRKKATAENGDKKENKPKTRHQHESLKSYLRVLLKQVHPELGIKISTLAALDLIIKDLGNRIDKEASKLCKTAKKHTITQRQMQTAVRILLPGELSKHAIAEGIKAMNKYTNSKANQPAKPKKDKKEKKEKKSQ